MELSDAPDGQVGVPEVVQDPLEKLPLEQDGVEMQLDPLKLIPEGQVGDADELHVEPLSVPAEQLGTETQLVPDNDEPEGQVGFEVAASFWHCEPNAEYPAGQLPATYEVAACVEGSHEATRKADNSKNLMHFPMNYSLNIYLSLY